MNDRLRAAKSPLETGVRRGHGLAYLARTDPRLRILVAVAWSVVVALADRFDVLVAAAVATVVGLVFSGLSWRVAAWRLLPLNLVMLILLAVLPWTTVGTPIGQWGPLVLSQEGLWLWAAVVLKGNTIVLALLVLLGSMEGPVLGHALTHLRVPRKLAHLLLFTVRYLDVLHGEYRRMRCAMRVRAFRPRMDRHTYRALGYLVGMLLVRSLDRAERVMAAMKCRGFRGRFYVLDHFHYSWGDVPLALVSIALLLVLIVWEWA